jgi:hypothetical protein
VRVPGGEAGGVGGGLAGADLGSGGRGGLGHLLAQQLVAAGERVLDVPPKLAARVRLLEAGDTNKNDPNDALSVAIAALRSKARRPVLAEDYAAVLKVWAKRHRDLARARNQVACRLHAVLCELVPGGFSKEITAGQASRILEQAAPPGASAQARHELACQFLNDLRNLDTQLRATKKKLAARSGRAGQPSLASSASGPSSPAPSSATPATFRASPAGGTSPPITAPPGRGLLREPEDLPAVAARQPAAQPRPPHGRDHSDQPPAQRRPHLLRPEDRRGKDPQRSRALPHCGGSPTRSTPASKPTPARPRKPRPRAREGNRGTTLSPARPAHTPQPRLFGQATPGPATTLRPIPHGDEPSRRRRSQRKPGAPLDNKRKEVSFCAVIGTRRCLWGGCRAGCSARMLLAG